GFLPETKRGANGLPFFFVRFPRGPCCCCGTWRTPQLGNSERIVLNRRGCSLPATSKESVCLRPCRVVVVISEASSIVVVMRGCLYLFLWDLLGTLRAAVGNKT